MNQTTVQKEQHPFIAYTAIKKWGNSQGIRLSKEIINRTNLKESDEVGISIDNGKIIIEKISKPKYPNLLERLEAYYGKTIDEIYVEDSHEIDTGVPEGNEIW